MKPRVVKRGAIKPIILIRTGALFTVIAAIRLRDRWPVSDPRNLSRQS